MSDEESSVLRKYQITIPRRIVQIISFLVINYTILDLLFFHTINFDILEGLTKALPVLNTPRNPLSRGAGFLEYFFFIIADGIFPFLVLGGLILVFLFFNRFFCGWICPIGAIQDGLCGFNKNKKQFKPEVHDYLIKAKYLIIVILLLFIVPLGFSKINDINFYFEYKENLGEMAQKPLGYFSLSEYIFVFIPNLFTEIWNEGDLTLDPINPWIDFPGISGQNTLTLFVFIFYIVILVLSVWYPRFYCKYLCPLGAVGAAVGQFSLLKLSRSPVKCVGRAECGICERECPKQIRILDEPFEFFTGKGECNLCMKCKEVCPHQAINIKLG